MDEAEDEEKESEEAEEAEEKDEQEEAAHAAWPHPPRPLQLLLLLLLLLLAGETASRLPCCSPIPAGALREGLLIPAVKRAVTARTGRTGGPRACGWPGRGACCTVEVAAVARA